MNIQSADLYIVQVYDALLSRCPNDPRLVMEAAIAQLKWEAAQLAITLAGMAEVSDAIH